MPTHAQPTPNPNAHRFALPQRLFTQPINCSTPEAAAAHPLAARLFALDGVYNVLLAQDFVTINKRPDLPWDDLDPRAAALIDGWLAEGAPHDAE
jgi:hypothetical protein